MITISTVLSIAVACISVVSILIGVVAWCFKIVTRVSILETEMESVKEIQSEIKQDIKEILKLLREQPLRR